MCVDSENHFKPPDSVFFFFFLFSRYVPMPSQPPTGNFKIPRQPVSGIKQCLMKDPRCSEISPFSHPFTFFWSDVQSVQQFLTVEEVAMINLSWEIRKKPEWWIKYKDPEIVAKWKREAQEEREEDCIPGSAEPEENDNDNDYTNRDVELSMTDVAETEITPEYRNDSTNQNTSVGTEGSTDGSTDNSADSSSNSDDSNNEEIGDNEDFDEYIEYDMYEDEEVLAVRDLDRQILSVRRRQRREGRMPLRDSLFKYVIDELSYYERIREQLNGQFQNGSYLGIVYGDKVVSENIKNEFIKAAQKLEDATELEKDWHPGSNERVLDLVHPSLYPLQYLVTPVVADLKNDHVGFELSYKGKTVPMYQYKVNKHAVKTSVEAFGIGENFQWLPSLFEVSEDGSKVEIKSYINNLHPVHHRDLYKPIGDIFQYFIPAINIALTEYATGQRLRIDYGKEKNWYYEPEPKELKNSKNYYYEYDKWFYTRTPILLDPVYKPVPPEEVCNIDVRGSTLKVIVKMANIELTPEKPDYPGGTWHVEGTINEDIVCTCLYYYDCENITHSELEFRAGTKDPYYEQGDSCAISRLYGITDEEELVFPCGSIEAIDDRLVVFPNMFQHRVAPFELKDKTKPGHRKILCFFVCDPYNDNVISTDQVPPQQGEWWAEQTFSVNDNDKKNATLFNKLPPEILNSILENVTWPMPLPKAKEVREQLINERAQDIDEDDIGIFQRTFSLCEH